MGERRNSYKNLVGKPEMKRPLDGPRRMWEDGIAMGNTMPRSGLVSSG
jgi:hypothetical protein